MRPPARCDEEGKGVILVFDHIAFRYPRASAPVLRGVSCTVAPGEHVALLGGNGSGKSTLSRLACGLLLPSSGRVTVDGDDTADRSSLRTIRTRVGFVAQDPTSQIVSSSVLDEVAFGPENLGLDRGDIARRCRRALEAVGLSGREEREPHTLSGGEQQRLVIAGALAMEPDYLVLDEPCDMLDGAGRAEVLAVIERLRGGGCGVVHVTHDLYEALRADRVLLLAGGRVVFDGTPADFVARGLRGGADAVSRSPMLDLTLRLLERGVDVPATTADPVELARLTRKAVSWGVDGGGGVMGATSAVADRTGCGEDGASVLSRHETTGPANAADGYARPVHGADASCLVARSLDYTYARGTSLQHHALAGVSLSAASGEVLLVSGQAGSGKSTLLELCAGLLVPDAGSVTLNGRPAHAGAAGLVFQKPEDQLFAETVLDDVAFGPLNQGCDENEARSRARRALGVVGVDDDELLGRSPFLLSGGQARLVALAGVLACERQVLLLDEPAAGLDASGMAMLRDLLAFLRDAGRCVVVVTHDVDALLSCADRVLLLDGGSVVWEGTRRSVVEDPSPLVLAGLPVPGLLVFQEQLDVASGARSLDPARVAETVVRGWR